MSLFVTVYSHTFKNQPGHTRSCEEQILSLKVWGRKRRLALQPFALLKLTIHQLTHLQSSIAIFVQYNSSYQICDLALFGLPLYLYLCLSVPFLLPRWVGGDNEVKAKFPHIPLLRSVESSLGADLAVRSHLGPES